MRYVTFAAALVLALSMPLAAQQLDADLQKAIQTETVTGDLKAVIEQYRRIAEAAGSGSRAIAAQALARMAECHRKLGDAEATKIYERIVRDFSDRPEAAEARTRLAGMRTSSGAPASQIARQIWTGPDVDPMGAASADGRFLSYTDWDTGDLGLRDLGTGQNRRLTNTGGWEKSGDFAEHSVPSPDGTHVAYAWYIDKPSADRKDHHYELRLIATGPGETARPRVLHAGTDLNWVSPNAWTPDGQHLVFSRQRTDTTQGADLALLSIKTGEIRTIRAYASTVFAKGVHVSPDGRYVAYDLPASHPRSARDIQVSTINGSVHTVVAANSAEDSTPLFSSAGSTLLFISNRGGSNGIWAVTIRDGKPEGSPRLLKPDVGAFTPLGLTRAGALYYFSGGDRYNSYLAPVDAALASVGEPVMLTDRFQNQHMSAAWSPDGRSVAYYTFQGLRENLGATLVIRTAGSGQEREFPLKVRPTRFGQPVKWFPDGRSVLVSGQSPDGTSYYVHSRLDLSDGSEQPLLTSAQLGAAIPSAVVSADAGSIVYIRGDGQLLPRSLRRLDLGTGVTTVLIDGDFHGIALSSDGRHLAYLSWADTYPRTVDIGILPLAGGERKVIFNAPMTDISGPNAFSWTPDGRHILFVRSDDAGGTALWRIPAAGGAAQKTGIAAKGQIGHPSLHPDGSRLLYSVRETDASVWVLENFLPAPAGRK